MTTMEAMRVVARRLNALEVPYTFLGAAVLPLLVDDPALLEIRPTKDVDVSVEIATLAEHYQLEEKLRAEGFRHDTREGAPICRWVVEEVTVDIMPTEASVFGFAAEWFKEGLETAERRSLGEGLSAPVVRVPYFLATKLAAFRDRGVKDFYASKDLEDILTLADGCEAIVRMVGESPPPVREFISAQLRMHLANAEIVEVIPAYFRYEPIAQERAKIVMGRLRQLTGG